MREKSNIEFNWTVVNNLGKVKPKKDGGAIFKAGSKVGATTLEVEVKDLKTNKILNAKIEIAITHPPSPSGKLARVKIEPMRWKLPLGEEREYKAIAKDEDRNPITKGVTFQWSIVYDESLGAKLNINQGESVILTPGRSKGSINLQVTAYQNGRSAKDLGPVYIWGTTKLFAR